MNKEIWQLAAASVLAIFCVSAEEREVAMAKCTRTVPAQSSEENVGPYDEEYGDGTDVYGDGDDAPEAENQSQSWNEPKHAEPEYYIPETAAVVPVAEPVKPERKSAAQKAVQNEDKYSASN